MPESFEEQADVIWTHIQTLLRAAGHDGAEPGLAADLSRRPEYDEANVRMRVKYLGTHAPSSTVDLLSAARPALEAGSRSHGGDLSDAIGLH